MWQCQMSYHQCVEFKPLAPPEHVLQHGPHTRPTTCALNMSHNMGPPHVPQRVSRTHPTTWALNTSHNMGPEHISQHGSQARPTAWAPNTSPVSTYQYPLVPAGTHLFPPVPAVPAGTRQIPQVRRPATYQYPPVPTSTVLSASYCLSSTVKLWPFLIRR